MKFLSVPVSDAEGDILAHSFKSDDSGLSFRKGRVLSGEDCVALSSAGVEVITIARLEDGDIDENDAARQIGDALVSDSSGISCHSPFTGRVNLYARVSGLFCVSRDLVDSINRIDPSITLCTLPNDTIVESSRLIATIKIIPFGVSLSLVSRAVQLISSGSVMSIYSSIHSRVGLIATCLPSLKESVMDKTESVLSDRLSTWNGALTSIKRVSHDTPAVSDCLSSILPSVDLIVIFGASAICDSSDIIPRAICESGGEIIYFGMPVDPGNLLLLGRVSDKYVIGAPGCARSRSHNGFDWVLSRTLCGAPLDSSYMSGLGVGGLLMEISDRGHSREL